MATIDQLVADQQATTAAAAAVAKALTDLSSLVSSLQAQVASLEAQLAASSGANGTVLSAADQASVDEVDSGLQAANAQLTAAASNAENVVNPPVTANVATEAPVAAESSESDSSASEEASSEPAAEAPAEEPVA